MNRRKLLEWFSWLVGLVSAALVIVPGVRYLSIPLRRTTSKAIRQRIARLSDLPHEEPVLRAVTGGFRDAWTVHQQQRLGQVWLVRRSPPDVSAEETQVEAFTSVCPHLGCAVQRNAQSAGFVCPCHNAVFDARGNPLSDKELGYKNPTPRGLDTLECQIVQDAQTQEWWVEVTYQRFEYGTTKKIAKG